MEFTFGSDQISVNVSDQAQLLALMRQRLRAGQGFGLATINLDHLVKLRSSPAFRRAYMACDLIVADGRPIVWLSRLAGRPVDLVPGSELVMPTLQMAAQERVPVAFVGSSDAALADAATAIRAQIPDLQIAAMIAPPMGFDPESAAAEPILQDLSQSGVRFCILALGAPKQESLAALGRRVAPEIGFAGFGAGLDFLAGHQSRAPLIVRKIGMEWLWRALSNPLRLGPRYLRCIAILPGQIIAALRLRRGA